MNVNETDTLVDLGVDFLAGVCHFVGGTLAHGGDLVVSAVEVEVVDEVGGGGEGKDGEGVEVEV